MLRRAEMYAGTAKAERIAIIPATIINSTIVKAARRCFFGEISEGIVYPFNSVKIHRLMGIIAGTTPAASTKFRTKLRAVGDELFFMLRCHFDLMQHEKRTGCFSGMSRRESAVRSSMRSSGTAADSGSIPLNICAMCSPARPG